MAAACLLAAGCSSSSSTSHAAASAPATRTSVAATAGTETITGTVSGAAAEANNPTFPLTFRGPVNTTASWTPPGGSATTQVTTFKTTAGNLTVTAHIPASQQNAPPAYLGSPCRYGFTMHVTYVIDGSKSTGKWAGATGHGAVIVAFTAEFPKLSSGKCNISQNAQPVSGTSKAVFTAAGPVTLVA